jgi:hypothetical protein
MGYSGFKGIGPNKIGANKGAGISSPAKIAPLLAIAGKALAGAVASKAVDSATKMKSPAKEVDKAGQKIIKQGDKANAAYEAGNDKKGNRHTARAARMNTRDEAKKLKNNLKNSPAKKNKGMSYDIKEASNQKLSASARKHYAENAQAANKSGYKG